MQPITLLDKITGLENLRDNQILINACRGEVIDNEALACY